MSLYSSGENTHETHVIEMSPRDVVDVAEAEDSLRKLVRIGKRAPPQQIRKTSVGYVDTDPEQLGAAPMTGKDRHAWKKIQQVTFTNWINDRVSGAKCTTSKVKDLQKDLQDGLLLIHLLENLSKKKIRKVEKDPKVTAQKLANLELAFKFMKEEEVKLVGIGMYIHDCTPCIQ